MAKSRKWLDARERIKRLKTDREFRKQVFNELLIHVRGGFSLDCFRLLSEYHIKAFLEEFSGEFCKEELAEACRQGKEEWESIGKRQANGQCLGNSRSWYYNMSNRYGWREKQEVETNGTQAINVSIVSYQSSKQRETEA